MTPNTRALKGQSYCSQRWANPDWPKGSKLRGFSIKDYIVYHRDSNDGKNKKDIFPLGVLHNHVSGIDLTFEREGNDHEPIRFSALIREFWVNMENKKDKEDKYEMKGIDGSSENKPDNKPTHLYDALYSQFSVFDGFSVKSMFLSIDLKITNGKRHPKSVMINSIHSTRNTSSV